MRFQPITVMLAIPVLALAVAATAAEKTTSANSARFDAIKKLAGDWVENGKDGKPGDKVMSSYRLTASGTVVEETLFPGTDHEMVTMYHLDGADLVLTHYCILGNQPKMRAEPGTDANRIVFKFVSGTNMKSDADNHMDQATLNLVDSNHIKAEWVACKEGKPCHTANFDMVRKPK